MQSTTVGAIAERLGISDPADPDRPLRGVAGLDDAMPTDLSFFSNARYRPALRRTRAGAVLVKARDAAALPATSVALVVADPYAALATVLTQLHPAATARPGIDATARIDAGARVDSTAQIDAFAVVGAGAVIGAGVIVGAHCAIGDGATIGAATRLYPHVVVYHGCTVGARCILHAGVVVGADGFGFAPTRAGLLKVPQLGAARLGDDVELGAATTVDRGALGDTVIGDGVKLDNHVQVGHNVVIGAHTVIAAQSGIAGSTRIGRGCMIGGQAAIAGHLTIGDGVQIAGRSGVIRDVAPGSKVAGFPAVPHRRWLRSALLLDRLPQLLGRGGGDNAIDDEHESER